MHIGSVVMKLMKNGYYHVKHFEMLLKSLYIQYIHSVCCCVWYIWLATNSHLLECDFNISSGRFEKREIAVGS